MHAMTRAVALVLATALSLGCNGVSSPSVDRTAFGSRVSVWLPPSTAVLVHGYDSGLGDSTRLVISQLTARSQPQPPLPAVDFDTERLLLAALGQRNTGGYDIRIDSLVRFEHGSVAYVTTRAPGQSCGTTQALTHPVEIVRVSPAPLEPIAFDQQAVVVGCS